MENEKRRGVRISSLQFCTSQLTISCGINGNFFWTTFLEVMGSSRRLEEQESAGYRRTGRFEV